MSPGIARSRERRDRSLGGYVVHNPGNAVRFVCDRVGRAGSAHQEYGTDVLEHARPVERDDPRASRYPKAQPKRSASREQHRRREV